MFFFEPKLLIPIVLTIGTFYLVGYKYRQWVILLGSLVFATFVHPLAAIMVVVLSILNYQIGRILQKSKNQWIFWSGVVMNAGLLLSAKLLSTGEWSLNFNPEELNYEWNGVAAFVGLTFYGLQNIAYLTETYWRTSPPYESLQQFIIYNSFFPKLASGPIEDPVTFKQKFEKWIKAPTDKGDIIAGLQRILLGVFKKVVLADRLAISVHSVFDFSDPVVGLTSLTAAILFTVQVYFDFSGYMDIALGMGRLFGIRLKENFNYPLSATSISEFWRRWHISLIDWLTRYIYYPVSIKLRQQPSVGAVLSIFLTFFISGLWHGIGINFILYAMCHFIYITFEYFSKRIRKRASGIIPSIIYRPLSVGMVFFMVSLAFIFFRSSDFNTAKVMFAEIFTGQFLPTHLFHEFISPLASGGDQQAIFNLLVTVVLAICATFGERFLNNQLLKPRLNVIGFSFLVILILTFGIFDAGQRFIYIQF